MKNIPAFVLLLIPLFHFQVHFYSHISGCQHIKIRSEANYLYPKKDSSKTIQAGGHLIDMKIEEGCQAAISSLVCTS